MHPLHSDLKHITFEELEKRKAEINRRMQIMRRNQMQNPEIWNQLEMLLESIMLEQQERYQVMNQQSLNPHGSGMVLSTDPLEDDELPAKNPVTRTFRPVQ